MPVTHICNPSYLRGWHWEYHGLRAAQANSLQDPISKIARAKWTRDVAQIVKCLLCKCKALSSNPSLTEKNWNGSKILMWDQKIWNYYRKTLEDIITGNYFLNKMPNAQEIRVRNDKWNYIKLKSFCTAKEIITKIKR
jgi:hypothetical protein